MQHKPIRVVKKRAATPQYVSPNQLTLVGFDTPMIKNFIVVTAGLKWLKAFPGTILSVTMTNYLVPLEGDSDTRTGNIWQYFY